MLGWMVCQKYCAATQLSIMPSQQHAVLCCAGEEAGAEDAAESP